MPKKPPRLGAGNGWRWKGPKEVIHEGDELLGWSEECEGPCFQRLPYKWEGKEVHEVNFFIRTRKARQAPTQPKPETDPLNA
jgi:hypothetical protein